MRDCLTKKKKSRMEMDLKGYQKENECNLLFFFIMFHKTEVELKMRILINVQYWRLMRMAFDVQ